MGAGLDGCSSGIRSATRSVWFLTQECTFLNLLELPAEDFEDLRVGLLVRMRGVGGAWELVQLQRLSSCRWVSDFGESGGGRTSPASASREGGTSREDTTGHGLEMSLSDAALLILIISRWLVVGTCAISGSFNGGVGGVAAVMTCESG